jgi:hypothetical protein
MNAWWQDWRCTLAWLTLSGMMYFVWLSVSYK